MNGGGRQVCHVVRLLTLDFCLSSGDFLDFCFGFHTGMREIGIRPAPPFRPVRSSVHIRVSEGFHMAFFVSLSI